VNVRGDRFALIDCCSDPDGMTYEALGVLSAVVFVTLDSGRSTSEALGPL